MAMEQITTPIRQRRTVREWRAYRRMTKTEMATNLKVYIDTYTRMEDNPERIRVEDGERLANVFGCELKDIIFFEQKPNIMLDK